MGTKLKRKDHDVRWKKQGLKRPSPRTVKELQMTQLELSLPPHKDPNKVILSE